MDLKEIYDVQPIEYKVDRGLEDKFGDVDTKAFCKPYLKIESNVKTDMLRCAFGNDCRTGSELE